MSRIRIPLLIILIVSLSYLLLTNIKLKKNETDLRNKLNQAEYQVSQLRQSTKYTELDYRQFYAIFLSNGEYYFARLQNGVDYFVLTDVYFLTNYPDLKKLGISQKIAKIELKRVEENDLQEKLVRANLSQIYQPQQLNVLKKEVIYYAPLTVGSKVYSAIEAFEDGMKKTLD